MSVKRTEVRAAVLIAQSSVLVTQSLMGFCLFRHGRPETTHDPPNLFSE